VLEQPGLVRALGLVADEGAATVYTGSIAGVLLYLVAEREGAVTADDLASYRAEWREPVEVAFAGRRIATRGGLSGVPDAFARLVADGGPRALLAALEGERQRGSHTTNLCAVDADGNACVFTTSLGLGSGDWLPGLDLHLNSMLGETDLVRGGLEPGQRMGSMMAPSLALDGEGLALAAGAAGGTRLRSALLQVVAGILDEGLDPETAVTRPRLHPAAGLVHLEPGFEPEVVAALEAAGREVRAWPALHHYFGGVSVVARGGCAGDPRRSGGALALLQR
jgi:gamma-glutamyltranspeptidase/glutathione hydrolase